MRIGTARRAGLAPASVPALALALALALLGAPAAAQAPAAQAPTVQAPTVQAPTVQAPAVQAPAVQAPGARPGAAAPTPAAREAAEGRAIGAHLEVLAKLRQGCENAAWTLWHSNGYAPWRARKSPSLAMHYSGAFYPSLPAAPEGLPPALRERLAAALPPANEALREGAEAFKLLADYVNAKDYEGDRFAKGDALNARLLAAGRACYASYGALVDLTAAVSEALVARAGPPAPAAALMLADWGRARALSAELARGEGADLARLDALAAELTALVEARRGQGVLGGAPGAAPAPGDAASRASESFYEVLLNRAVAVRMRRVLREVRAGPRALKEAATDRPRSEFRILRSDIDVRMGEEVVAAARAGR